MRYLLPLALLLLCFNCKEKPSQPLDANAIINKTISVAGVKKLDSSTVGFDFRDVEYEAKRADGMFELQRQFKDSTGDIHDYLRNTGFERYVNDSLIKVPDSMATKYAASVNSVHYFAVLPYGLDGTSVNKTKLSDTKIKGKTYYKIKVTFNQDGGGEDFEDEFIYWVNTETFKIDYLAYSYNEDHGLGLRFREAFNERYSNGVRFVDYNNFKPTEKNADLESLEDLFQQNKLELLSKIKLKNISVN